MESFKNLVPQQALCIRNGEKKAFAARELVLGDIVEVKGGDRIPADLRIIQAANMKVDNSSLTGEPDHLSRQPSDDEGECGVQESTNMCFYTTKVMEGSGWGIVTAIGPRP